MDRWTTLSELATTQQYNIASEVQALGYFTVGSLPRAISQKNLKTPPLAISITQIPERLKVEDVPHLLPKEQVANLAMESRYPVHSTVFPDHTPGYSIRPPYTSLRY